MGEHKVYPLVNSFNFSAYRFAYWLIEPSANGKYVVLNVVYV